MMTSEIKGRIYYFFTWFVDFTQHQSVGFVILVSHEPRGVTTELEGVKCWVVCDFQNKECGVFVWKHT